MAYTDVDKPSEYFNTKLYTGTGATLNVTNLDFQPDFTWIKQRNGTYGHDLYDSVRGATKTLNTNNTLAEYTSADRLTSFNSDGFTLGTNASVNGLSDTYASWNWLASNTTASNTSGSITSNVSANTTSGFSIVSYTGTGSGTPTIGHGLGVVPSCIILKPRSLGSSNWSVYHAALGNANAIRLNSTSASFSANFWNSTTPSSTVFTIGTDYDTNQSGATMIAYCFAEKKGFSKFGSYTGNGNADGTFVYTGFKPAWVMIKRTNTSGDAWVLFDNKRPGYNLIDNFLEVDTSGAEAVNNPNQRIDTISNGFKCRGTGGATNVSGSTYIYMAFAENPLVSSAGVPCTAR